MPVCPFQRCSRRLLCCLEAEPHLCAWAACAGAWASISACVSRWAAGSSSSAAGCMWQLSRGCAQTLELCPRIGSHALPGACSCALAPVRRQPASVSPAGVLLARSNLSQPLPSCADWPRATHEAAPCHVNEWSVWRVVACRDSVSCYVISIQNPCMKASLTARRQAHLLSESLSPHARTRLDPRTHTFHRTKD